MILDAPIKPEQDEGSESRVEVPRQTPVWPALPIPTRAVPLGHPSSAIARLWLRRDRSPRGLRRLAII